MTPLDIQLQINTAVGPLRQRVTELAQDVIELQTLLADFRERNVKDLLELHKKIVSR